MLRTLAGMEPINGLEDGVFIVYHRSKDNALVLAYPSEWESLQASGEIADGVLVSHSFHHLVIAPDETKLEWSSANITGGGVSTQYRNESLEDLEGYANTEAQFSHKECSGIEYACGWCKAYKRMNKNGYGYLAGQWWLPSIGELHIIFSNLKRINYALSLINGAKQMTNGWYWSSTEVKAELAWHFNMQNSYIGSNYKVGYTEFVRPVSSFKN